MTPSERAAARAAIAAATPGPWRTKCNRKYCSETYHTGHTIRNDRNHKKGEPLHEDGSVGHEIAEISGGGMFVKYNSDFICLARNVLPEALDALDAAEKDLYALRAEIDHETRCFARLVVESAKLRAQLESASYPGHYISNACQRGRHENCRLNEKFSGEPCLCSCGHPGSGEKPPTYDELTAEIERLNKLLEVGAVIEHAERGIEEVI